MSAKASFGGANASKKCSNLQSSNSDTPVLKASDTATATSSFNVGPTAQHPTSLNQFLGVAASSELYTYCLTIPYIELTSDSLCTALLASQCEAGIPFTWLCLPLYLMHYTWWSVIISYEIHWNLYRVLILMWRSSNLQALQTPICSSPHVTLHHSIEILLKDLLLVTILS